MVTKTTIEKKMIHYVSLFKRSTGLTYFALKLGNSIQCDTILIEGFFSALNSISKNIFSEEEKFDFVKIGDMKIELITISDELQLDLLLIYDDFSNDLESLTLKIKEFILNSNYLFEKELYHSLYELDSLTNQISEEITKYNSRLPNNLIN